MDRADAGGVHRPDEPLPRGGFIVAHGAFQSVIAGAANAVSHLAGRGVGKRDGDELVEAGSLGRRGRVELGDEPFGQNESLPAPAPAANDTLSERALIAACCCGVSGWVAVFMINTFEPLGAMATALSGHA